MSSKKRERALRRPFSLPGRAAVCCGAWVLGVAVLPGAARGATCGVGNKYVSLGFDDFFYTPITRQNILATIGKYLGFEPITTPTD